MANTFVYSMDYGLGYILEEKEDSYKIKYKNKIVENVSQFQFQFLNNDMIKFIMENKFEWMFDYQSLNRAEIVQYSSFTKASISLSLSTISFKATL